MINQKEAQQKENISHPVVSHFLDLIMSPLYHYREEIIKDARGDVLEIGVGTGLNLPLYSADTTVTAIDPDLSMLKKAKERQSSAKINLVQAWAENLFFDDKSFDTIVITFTLCTIPSIEKALKECHRVLKDDGQLLFAEHVCSKRPFLSKTQNILTPLWKKIAGGCHLDRHTENDIPKAQFKITHITRCADTGLSPLPIIYGRASKLHL